MPLGSQDVVWSFRLMDEICMKLFPVSILSYNRLAIMGARGNKLPKGRTKHIDVSFHLIHDPFMKFEDYVCYVPSE